MDIKKLGLASTIAVLSVTMSLGGCDLFKSQAEIKYDKVKAKWQKALDEVDKARKEEINTAERKQALSKAREAEREFGDKSAEYKKAIAELSNIPTPKLDKANDEYDKALAEYKKAGAEYYGPKGW
ncbi:hypothetical protein C0030_002260 [Candidatus Liberibacter solanacearum]|uniref:Lipoprotein n=1 Tax=Candidatus Liberibacter solanacearum TaxID=556287 RepID=A0A424FMR6_9HYPH|nr:hypothetical protein [Candidatus Liberibacter solanacearum]RPD37424.1 hypothetical protein C0030_002260 [Candidatus Liberibacter solanacearum]